MLRIKNSKIFFLLDNIKRFKSDQILFLIYDRFVKKVLWKFYKTNYQALNVNEFDNNFNSKLHQIFEVINLNLFNSSHSNLYHSYHKFLLSRKLEPEFNNDLWVITDNFELNNNYQRFHLFYLLFEKNNELFKIEDLILLWINKHEKIEGLAWNSFNCSIRLINWFRLFSLLPVDYQFNKKNSEIIQNSIYIQVQHILHNIEHHIPGNHIILQYFSLILVFEIFPNWELTKKNRDNIQKKFENEISREFFDNGFHFEQSYHYHIQITLMCLLWLNANKNNSNVSEEIINRIKNAVKATFNFRLASNYLPMLGDNCFNFFNPTLYDDFNQIEYLQKKIFSHLETGDKKLIEYANQYIIYRGEKNEIIFDIGNIGLKCNPGHGHADISNILYTSCGVPIFIDAGTRMYSNSIEDLKLKKTLYHNTLNINNVDQSKLWGFFRWAYLPKKLNSKILETDEQLIFINEFDGFFTLGKYHHERKIIIEKSTSEIKIIDSVDGKGKKNIFLNFILHPEIDFKLDNNKMILTSQNFSWELSADNTHKLQVNELNIYPNYDVPIKSLGLKFQFNSVNFPFENTTVIKKIEKTS